MKSFADISHISLNKAGEELCGDQVRILKMDDKTRVVLSDGLGSGVKANILATLTSEIIITMLREEIPFEDVLETVIGTLPICKIRQIAYSTFSILEIDHVASRFQVINFDNPFPLYFKKGKITKLPEKNTLVLNKKIQILEGPLEEGDFLAMVSDGVLYAGPGQLYNFNWNRDNLEGFLSEILQKRVSIARNVVSKVMTHTDELYEGYPGDDATMVGVYFRPRRSAMVFTGPPLKKEDDEKCARMLLEFDGRRIVCGGTTGEIVARFSNQEIETDNSTLYKDVPPVGYLEGVHLLTEGVLTLVKTADVIEAAEGEISNLPWNRSAAVLLSIELLAADDITFLVGQQINSFYQNPILPMSVSIRKNLVERLAGYLRKLNKDVEILYF